MYTNDITRRFEHAIEQGVGLPVKTIREQSYEDTMQFIEKRLGKKLEVGKNDMRVPVQGDVLLFHDRQIKNADTEFDAKFKKKRTGIKRLCNFFSA